MMTVVGSCVRHSNDSFVPAAPENEEIVVEWRQALLSTRAAVNVNVCATVM
jgi:hypothetical protein